MGRPLTPGGVTGEEERFLTEYIAAPEQLDILFLLQRSPDKAWTALEVSQAVYTVPPAAQARLDQLVASGLAASDGQADPRYRYHPSSTELHARVERVADAYIRDRATLIKAVLARSQDPARAFADAFRLRRSKE